MSDVIGWHSMRCDPLFWSALLRPRVNSDGVVNGKAVMHVIRNLAKTCELAVFDNEDVMDVGGDAADAEDIATAEMRVAMYMWTAVSRMEPRGDDEEVHVRALKEFCAVNTVAAMVCAVEHEGASIKTFLTGNLNMRPSVSLIKL